MQTLDQLREMPDKQKAAFLIAQELHRRTESKNLDSLFPDEGPLRRELYFKHLDMFAAGVEHNERCCLGGNRVGKTFSIGGYETAIHMTGLYPEWWVGRKFTKQILAWAGGTKAVKVRDVNQKFLVGQITPDRQLTGGLIPAAKLKRFTRKSHGVADAIDQIIVKHKSGWDNTLTFKSYEEGRTSFEAEGIDWIWLDEEPTREIYDECKLRLLTTRGSILSTMTPVEGMTECVLGMLEGTDMI
jgi:phage terminase large subunit-like protein